MTILMNSIGAITLFVDDIGRSKAWYRTVFDRPVIFEDDVSTVIQFDNTIVNLLAVRAAHDLIAPATVADSRAGSQVQLTVWVEDADAACADLQLRGVTLLNGPMKREWGQRTACSEDPDGHLWEIAQTLS